MVCEKSESFGPQTVGVSSAFPLAFLLTFHAYIYIFLQTHLQNVGFQMERQRGTVLPVNVSAVKQQKAGLQQRGLNLDAPPGSALLLSVFPFISLRVFGKESGKKNLRPTLLSACEALCHFPHEVPLLLLRCLHSKAGMFWQRCRQLIGSHPGPLEDLTAGGFDS